MGGSAQRKLRRTVVRQWTSHTALPEFQKLVRVAGQSAAIAFAYEKRLSSLENAVRQLVEQVLGNVPEETMYQMYPDLYRLIYEEKNAETDPGSEREDDQRSEAEVPPDSETAEVRSGVCSGPEQRESSSDSGGIRSGFSQGHSIEIAPEHTDSVDSRQPFHRQPSPDLRHSRQQPTANRQDS